MTRKIFAILCLVFGSLAMPIVADAQDKGIKKPAFDSGGVPIHYVVQGREDGEPVVLIHGFTGNIERQWPQTIEALKKEYKIIAMDCRGHGGSGKPHDPKKYGIEMVNDVARLLDHLKVDKAHIVGYSMGAGIALVFTVNQPKRVLTLTMGGGGAPDVNREKVLVDLAESLEMGKGLGPLIKALAPKNGPRPSAAQIKFFSDSLLAFNDPKALAAVIRGVIGNKEVHPTEKQIQEIRVPVLALIGANDPVRPTVNALKELLPDTRVVVVRKADHVSAFRSPEFTRSLRQFLDENRRPTKE